MTILIMEISLLEGFLMETYLVVILIRTSLLGIIALQVTNIHTDKDYQPLAQEEQIDLGLNLITGIANFYMQKILIFKEQH